MFLFYLKVSYYIFCSIISSFNYILIFFFWYKLNKRVFKKGKLYKFNYMIRTDGISCCILFIRVDKNGKPLSKLGKINNVVKKKILIILKK